MRLWASLTASSPLAANEAFGSRPSATIKLTDYLFVWTAAEG
jgi:hypothetical protein